MLHDFYLHGDSYLRTSKLNSLEIFKPVSIQAYQRDCIAKDLAW